MNGWEWFMRIFSLAQHKFNHIKCIKKVNTFSLILPIYEYKWEKCSEMLKNPEKSSGYSEFIS